MESEKKTVDSLKKVISLTLLMVLVLSPASFAEEYVPMSEYTKLAAKVEELEKRLALQDKNVQDQSNSMTQQKQKMEEYEAKFANYDSKLHREEGKPFVEEYGLKIGAGGTFVLQGTNNANGLETKNHDRTDASYSTDITIEKQFKELSSEAFLHLENGQGAGLEDQLTLFSNVNRDASDDTHMAVTEFWYNQGLLNDKVFFAFGKLDPTVYFDNNNVANDETTQFLGRIFRNNPTIEFPDNTAGIKTRILPWEWLEVGYGAFDGYADWEKIGDNMFHMVEFNLKPNFMNLEGNYRFYGWQSNCYHTQWLATEEDKKSSHGFGLSVDQKTSDIVTIFARYGWQNPQTYNPEIMGTGDLNYSLEHSWSAGFQVEGKLWNRQKDILALAVGQTIASGDYKKAGAGLDPVRLAKSEGHLEAYYNIHINDHLSISPDIQYIWNPFGKDIIDDAHAVFVYGLRAQVDF